MKNGLDGVERAVYLCGTPDSDGLHLGPNEADASLEPSATPQSCLLRAGVQQADNLTFQHSHSDSWISATNRWWPHQKPPTCFILPQLPFPSGLVKPCLIFALDEPDPRPRGEIIGDGEVSG